MSEVRVLPLRVWAARTQQRLGWAGVVGVALLVTSAAWLAAAWQVDRMPLPEEHAAAVPVPAINLTNLPVPVARLELPRRGEVALVLTQIQQAVVSQGLGWTAADYKLLAATDTAPAVLEVRCSLKGAYPKVRAATAQLLHDMPGLTIRDLSMSRPNIDLADVDAKLTLGVFLQDEPSGVAAAAASGARP